MHRPPSSPWEEEVVPVRPVAARASGSNQRRRSAVGRRRGTPRDVGMVGDAEVAPSRADGSGTFSVATWNIRSGRNGGLESALRTLESLEVDLAFLTETKLTGGYMHAGDAGTTSSQQTLHQNSRGEWHYAAGQAISSPLRRQ